MPVRCPAVSPCFRANASKPFITSCPVRNTRRYVFASPPPSSAAVGSRAVLAEDSCARLTAGATTANPAAAKKHRRVSERLPGVSIGSSFPGARVSYLPPCRALRPLPLALVTSFPIASAVPRTCSGSWGVAQSPLLLICNALNDDQNRGGQAQYAKSLEKVARELSERLEICQHNVCQRGAHVASCPCSIGEPGQVARKG